jgi:hypothetical protein
MLPKAWEREGRHREGWPSGSVDKTAGGCTACIKSTSHPPSLLLPFPPQLPAHSSIQWLSLADNTTRLAFRPRGSCVPELSPKHSLPNGHLFNNLVETVGKVPVIHRCLRTQITPRARPSRISSRRLKATGMCPEIAS